MNRDAAMRRAAAMAFEGWIAHVVKRRRRWWQPWVALSPWRVVLVRRARKVRELVA